MRKVLKYLVRRLLLGFDRLVTLRLKDSHKTGLALIRLDAIGDFILWLDTAKEYRRLYPNQKITLIANAVWADMARMLPYWDEVWSVSLRDLSRNPLCRWAFLCRVRKAKFETAIQPTFSRVFMQGDSVIRASCATNRIGSIGDMARILASDKAVSDAWYTRLVPANSSAKMELLRNAEFIQNLSHDDFRVALPQWPMLSKLPVSLLPQGPYSILFPGGSWRDKLWPNGFFADLSGRLYRKHGWRVVLCGSATERALCDLIAHTSGVACLNLAGQTTLPELAELIRGAQCLIGNDTSAVHLAAAVGTPAVCILGGGHYGRFMPYPDTVIGVKPVVAAHQMPCFNCGYQCNQLYDPAGPVPCVAQVSVDVVMDCVTQAIKPNRLTQGVLNNLTV